MTKKVRLGLVSLVVGAGLLLGACGGGATFELVDAATAYEITQEPPSEVILDVRTPEEYAEAHLEGSVLIDFYSPTFESELDELDKDVPYLVYCRSGNRSESAVQMMKDLGFTEVYEIEGGILSWASAGYPLAA